MPSDSFVLGFDTSAAHCAAALLCGDRVVGLRREEMAKGQAERLMPLLAEVLAEAGIGWSDLARIGVGVGPGNFTGIRIAVSAARGLALALGVPAVGVSGFQALAYGLPRPVLASLDARRGAVYVQRLAGEQDDAPVLLPLDTVARHFGDSHLTCVGTGAAEIAAQIGTSAATQTIPVAEAIARIAAKRDVRTDERPAPLYVRSADAAPPREAPPVILL